MRCAELAQLANHKLLYFDGWTGEKQNDIGMLAGMVWAFKPQYLISVKAPWIFPKTILEDCENCLNIHCAPLPEYKGHHCAEWALEGGATFFGATMHWMADAPDAGPIAFQERFPVKPGSMWYELWLSAQHSGVNCFLEFLACIDQGKEIPKMPMAPGGKWCERRHS
jgi:methionyl-tRNA formyltransferase